MKAVFARSPFDIQIRDVEARKPGIDEVLVRVRACGLCGTDLHFARDWQGEHQPLGHEIAAEVVEVGDGNVPYKPGDRVIVEDVAQCGICAHCKSGKPYLCRNMYDLNGQPGMAEMMTVNYHLLEPFEGIDWVHATLVEPMAVAYNTVLNADQLAAHGEGKELTNKGLIGDWTFDELKDGVFPNTAGDGLDGKIVEDVEHVVEGDGGYVRMSGKKGYVRVENDPRLNMSKTCTLEAWVRPKKGRGLASSEGIIIDRSRGGAPCGFRFDVNSGLSSKGMHGHDVAWLRAGVRYPTDSWAHVAAVYDVNGMRKLYVNGKLVGELKRRVQIIVP